MIIAIASLFSSLSTLVVAQLKEPLNIGVMSYNIRNGVGLDGVISLERISEVIKRQNPDIVALQEVDSVTQRSKMVDVTKKLATLTDMYGFFGAAIPFDSGKYGVAILSKEEPISIFKRKLPGREEQRVLLIVEFDSFYFFVTHWSLNEEDRASSIKIINDIAMEIDKPILLAGDLNALPYSSEIIELSRSWNLLSCTDPTYPADNPNEAIDYIWGYSDKKYLYDVLRSEVIVEKVASDHRPLFSEVQINGD